MRATRREPSACHGTSSRGNGFVVPPPTVRGHLFVIDRLPRMPELRGPSGTAVIFPNGGAGLATILRTTPE